MDCATDDEKSRVEFTTTAVRVLIEDKMGRMR
jgi:hypothetical protein